MTPEQIEHNRQLIAALRSGKYEQSEGALRHDENSFCCLGVACNISGIGQWQKGSYVASNESSDTWLTPTLMRWLGVPELDGPTLSIDDILASAATHNDNGCSFAEIADAWEAWLEQEIDRGT